LQQAGWPNRGLPCRVAGPARGTVFIGAGEDAVDADRLSRLSAFWAADEESVNVADGDEVQAKQ
jgi:hypothetical protein